MQPMDFRATAGWVAQAVARALAVAGVVAIAMVISMAIEQGNPVAAAEVTVDIQPQGDAVVVKASAVVDADAAIAWRVLTDYDRYREFVPGLRTSRVVASEGTHVTVEQTGVAPLWLLRLPMTVTYHIVESPPTSLRSRAETPGAGLLRSTYALTPVTTSGAMRLDYRGTLTVAPGLVAPLRKAAAEQAIVEHFRALTDEMERQARSHGPRMAGTMGAGDGTSHR
jgi:hypothetical protein